MKLEEGMYVRTKDGTIDKITKDEYGVCSCPSSNSVYCEHHILATFIITKASYNIIDLIEVGDYVNGAKVDNIILKDDKEICFRYKYAFEKEDVYTLHLEDIKSIVTSQQFESMSYKVGD